jgi:hypothetical protein
MIGNNIIQILFLIFIIIFIKKFGLTTYGRRRKIRSYIDVTENEKRKILLKVKIKKFFIFDREKTYELKYIKVKSSIEEVKVYFDVILKDKEYLIREVESNNFFDFKKKAIIYIRDSIPAFDRVPIRFLPETELKSLIREIIELDIAELEHTDFKTFVEKISYSRLVKELKNKMENDRNEKE